LRRDSRYFSDPVSVTVGMHVGADYADDVHLVADRLRSAHEEAERVAPAHGQRIAVPHQRVGRVILLDGRLLSRANRVIVRA
jgi:hypothetical protein